MYAYKRIAKRRLASWVERRRYFKRLLARTGSTGVKSGEKRRTV